MTEFTLRHPLDCTPKRHWELFFDPEWTRTLIIEGLGFFTCDVHPVRQETGKRHRDMEVTPKLDVPAAVAKIIGPKLGYTERATFDEATEAWTYRHILNVLTEKVLMGGVVTIEPVGDDRCVRVAKMSVEVKIFGVGGLVEKAAEKNMRDGWDRSAQWINRWLADHPETPSE
ncbi:DUF2505 family protein [Paraliomyxa miuraensis]|uniref:DUF2505 family protein n=1 Tax=Paraliomyxa miuraensis TaxID=376150 RepID=UPI002250F881|nr:DUF2505 family protein [Paraliomyxa miuraensis]MCX4243311.1 DUF2505 domain-containing protein [Paraliomyxa miuraensis]